MNYNIDHDALPDLLTPTEERTPEGKAFLKTLLKPFKTLYNQFIAARNFDIYKLQHSAQIIYLEKVLNEQFNNSLPAYTNGVPTGIYIGKPLDNRRAPVLRRKVEQRPPLVLWSKNDPFFDASIHKKIVLRKKQEYLSNIKFIVYVPFACFNVTTNTQQTIKMKGWIQFYNDIANYKIINY